MSGPRRDLTELLVAWSEGDRAALDALMPLVNDELRRMARGHLRRESPSHTLQPTALVNELYLRLTERRSVSWQSRAQFFAFAAQTMRRILVDHARRRRRAKRGGGAETVLLDESLGLGAAPNLEVLALDEALTDLATLDARRAQVVELRVFGGLSIEETAHVLGIGSATVNRDWAGAIAFLYRALQGPTSGGVPPAPA